MNTKFKKVIIYLAAWVSVLSPIAVHAQLGNLVPCGETDPTECGPKEFFELLFNVVEAVIFLGIAFSAIVFAYAGFLYIKAQGNQETIKKATRIFTNVAVGLFFALIAYMIIELITNSLGLRTDIIPISF